MQDDEATPARRRQEDKDGEQRARRGAGATMQRGGAVLLLLTLACGNASAGIGVDGLVPEPTPTLAVGTDTVLDIAGQRAPSCSKSGDDNGFGGTHVTCYYRCAKLAELTIGVSATDPDARAYGDTSCGGASATCENPTRGPDCFGASGQLTKEAQDKASCKGHSDEVWDSPITVSCSTTGEDSLCELVPDAPVCDDDGSAEDDGSANDEDGCKAAPCDGPNPPNKPIPPTPCPEGSCLPPTPRDACLRQEPRFALLGPATLEALFPQDSDRAETHVAAYSTPDGGLWALFEDGVCTSGVLATT